ncbi:MAG: hypothetical protein WCT05_05095 [Lentisphaeria bacterium]
MNGFEAGSSGYILGGYRMIAFFAKGGRQNSSVSCKKTFQPYIIKIFFEKPAAGMLWQFCTFQLVIKVEAFQFRGRDVIM